MVCGIFNFALIKNLWSNYRNIRLLRYRTFAQRFQTRNVFFSKNLTNWKGNTDQRTYDALGKCFEIISNSRKMTSIAALADKKSSCSLFICGVLLLLILWLKLKSFFSLVQLSARKKNANQKTIKCKLGFLQVSKSFCSTSYK